MRRKRQPGQFGNADKVIGKSMACIGMENLLQLALKKATGEGAAEVAAWERQGNLERWRAWEKKKTAVDVG